MTFASFLDPAGIIIAAGIITSIVELGKRVFPNIYERVNGLQQAFILSAVLYVLTAISVAPSNLDGYLTVFLAWLTCATAAVGVYEAASRTVGAVTNPK